MAKKKVPEKKEVKKSASAKPAVKTGRVTPAARRANWLDKKSHPLIEDYARRLDTFIATLADGKVDATEVEDQEERLVDAMKEVEPQLDNALHAQVTQLLCELTAYNLMHMLYLMQESRPKTTFQG
jgi:hypothetical protein